MKAFLLFAACLTNGAAAHAIFQRHACHADNCLRAVIGTADGPWTLSQHIQGCFSYFSVTVSPATR